MDLKNTNLYAKMSKYTGCNDFSGNDVKGRVKISDISKFRLTYVRKKSVIFEQPLLYSASVHCTAVLY